MTARQASCSCGALTLTCEDDPVRVSICHCSACQRRTGSAFGVQARFPRSSVTLHGEASTWLRVGDGGSRIVFRFCPNCGDTQSYSFEGNDEWIIVPVGAFADATFPAPTASVYDDRQHPWLQIHGLVDRMA